MKDVMNTEEEVNSLMKIVKVESSDSTSNSEQEEFSDILEDSFLKEEKVGLTRKQKLATFFIGVVSFFIFTFLFFPYDAMIKFYLNEMGKNAGFSVDFKEMDFSFTGNIKLQNASILIGKAAKRSIKVELIDININPISLYNDQVLGDVSMIGPSFSIPNIANFKFKSLLINIDIDGLKKIQVGALNSLVGSFSLVVNSGNISSLTQIPFIGNLGEVKHKKTNISFEFNQGNLLIKRLNNETSMGNIEVKGNILVESSIGNSILDINVCPKLDKEFKAKRQDLDGMLLLIQNRTGSECFPFGGTFSQPTPKFQFPI